MKILIRTLLKLDCRTHVILTLKHRGRRDTSHDNTCVLGAREKPTLCRHDIFINVRLRMSHGVRAFRVEDALVGSGIRYEVFVIFWSKRKTRATVIGVTRCVYVCTYVYTLVSMYVCTYTYACVVYMYVYVCVYINQLNNMEHL